MANVKDPAVLKGTLREIERQYGKNAIVTLEGASGASRASGEEVIESTSTGSLGLDLATGIGGYPKARVVELFGPAGSGKTTLALHAIVASQAAGGVVAFIDSDHTFDVSYARAVGVDLCTFCPYASRQDWRTFARELPEDFARVVELEARKPPTRKNGAKLSIRNFRTIKNADGTKTYKPTMLPVYVASVGRSTKVKPCRVCGAAERATKATGCGYLDEEGRAA